MPSGYEKMRDKFMYEDGLPEQEAKAKAAAIWNSKHPEDPVSKGYDKPKQTNVREREKRHD